MTVCGSHKKPIWNTINIPSFPWHMVCCAAPKGPPGTAIMVAKVFCNITLFQWMETNETFQMKIGTEHCCRAKGHRLCIFFTPSVHPHYYETPKSTNQHHINLALLVLGGDEERSGWQSLVSVFCPSTFMESVQILSKNKKHFWST